MSKKKGITPREWRINVFEKELNNCNELLNNHRHELSEEDIEYFEKYKQKLEQDLLEECLLIMEPEDE